MKKIVIAIDGYSGTGKSSTAKQVASRLDYIYIDSGAMYRTVTYFFLKEKVDIANEKEIQQTLDRCGVSFEGSSILLNNRNIDNEIRTMEVNRFVSEVSTISAVRRKLVAQQQVIGREKGVVMDGRDIGTVVFPKAELKIFMTANMDIRAERRRKELANKGIIEPVSSIKDNLEKRDQVDTNREDSPLKKAIDAIEIDTSNLTLNQQINKIVMMAQSKIK